MKLPDRVVLTHTVPTMLGELCVRETRGAGMTGRSLNQAVYRSDSNSEAWHSLAELRNLLDRLDDRIPQNLSPAEAANFATLVSMVGSLGSVVDRVPLDPCGRYYGPTGLHSPAMLLPHFDGTGSFAFATATRTAWLMWRLDVSDFDLKQVARHPRDYDDP